MTKTKEELAKLKQEYDALTLKLKELTPNELDMHTGGFDFIDSDDYIDEKAYEK